MMKLVIVESPAKARTIEKFLGSDYRVEASFGHIRDLPSSAREIPARFRSEPWANMAVNTDADFAPVYIIPKENQKRVKELKKLVAEADEILLATDEDREGESISWHLLETLAPKIPVHRITFHEITRAAIAAALESPRKVDEQLVRAQEARRILDRLFGYSLSPVLWRRVRTKLSAGRVQSVALRLVVEREEQRRRFVRSEYWDVEAKIDGVEAPFVATLVAVGPDRVATGKDFDATTGHFQGKAGVRVLDRGAAEEIAARASGALPWAVSTVERKRAKQRPAPPFITSTLQQAASARLGFSPKQTMSLAQRLYEGVNLGGGEREGLITYMRTDSLTLSAKALGDAGAFIEKTYGKQYYDGPRPYRTRSKAAQEAHEAIRPTEMGRRPEDVAHHLRADELALYRLVWQRAVASQMADAQLDRTTVELTATIDDIPHRFRATGSILVFPGHLAVGGKRGDDTILPQLEKGQPIGGEPDGGTVETEAQGHETRPPARFTEATLVKKLEEEGIGRPSTYTPIITTIQDREYAVKRNGYLVPTYIGMAVTRLLREHFAHYVDVRFTAKLEDSLDDIAAGDENWVDFLARFYHRSTDSLGLRGRIEEELPRIDYPKIPVGDDPDTGEPIFVRIGRNSVYIERGAGDESLRVTLPPDLLIDDLTLGRAQELLAAQSRGEQAIGQDEASGEPIFVRQGPFGPYVQLGENGNKKRPHRVSLPDGMQPEDVDLDLARRLLSLPRKVGTDREGKEVTAGLGRYGPYVHRDGVYRSVSSLQEVFEVSLDDAIALLEAPRGARNALKTLGPHPESGVELQVIRGRYGPYVTDGSTNASVPKGTDPQTVTLEQAVELLATRAQRSAKKVLRDLGPDPESGAPLQLIDGRYGPYVTDGKLNASIPKGSETADVTVEQAVELLAARAKRGPAKKRRRKR